MSYWVSPVDVRGVSPVARWLLRRGTTQFKGQWFFPSVFQHTVRLPYEAPSFAARDGAMTTIFPAWLRLRLSYSLAGTAPHVVRASATLTPRPFLRSKNSQKTPHRYRIDTVLTSIRNRIDSEPVRCGYGSKQSRSARNCHVTGTGTKLCGCARGDRPSPVLATNGLHTCV